MLGSVAALVSRPRDFELVLCEFDLHIRVELLLECPFRATDGYQISFVDADFDFGRHRDRHFSNPRHSSPYQILQRISPPRRSRRALRPVISPFGVDTMLIPSPLRTQGISLEPL